MFKSPLIGLLAFMLIYSFKIHAQDKTNNKFGKGIKVVAADSSFAVKFGFRTQSLYAGVLNTQTQDYTDKFLIRRARLKFSGFAYSPKLTYKIELGLSNRDIGGADLAETGNSANIILDAVLKYNFYGKWSVWFGQTKLPGNIERVVSSANLQFVDRSRLNSRYNIDRDIGIQLHYNSPNFRYKGAVSTGEGRNITVDNKGGYDFTNRIEWLPFGPFTGKKEYSESDLLREESPKLMLSIAHDYNQRASRERGQKGDFVEQEKTLQTWFADAHFKYNGFSALVEYVNKNSIDIDNVEPVAEATLEPFYVGTGVNAQAGYLFKNNLELAARYTDVTPLEITQRSQNKQYTICLSKYIVGHALKVQTDATIIQEEGSPEMFMYRFQVEFSPF